MTLIRFRGQVDHKRRMAVEAVGNAFLAFFQGAVDAFGASTAPAASTAMRYFKSRGRNDSRTYPVREAWPR